MESMKNIIANMTKQKEQLCNNDQLQDEYCEKCNTRKSVVIEILGQKRKMPCLCKCESDKIKEQQLIEENKQKQMRLDKLKMNSLMDKKFEQCTFKNWKMDASNKKMYELGINYTKNWQKMKKDSQVKRKDLI